MYRTVLTVSLILLLAVPALADYDRGVSALTMGDFVTALEEFREAAKQGNPEAQFDLGLMYERAQGVSEDPAEAALWYRKAAAQGHDLAQKRLGRLARSD